MERSILERVLISDFILAVIIAKKGDTHFNEKSLEDAIIECCKNNKQLDELFISYNTGANNIKEIIIDGVLSVFYLRNFIKYNIKENKIEIIDNLTDAESELKFKYGITVMHDIEPFANEIWKYAESKISKPNL